MTKLRTGEPWMPARDYGRTLDGLSLNLLVRDVQRSLPFYTEVLGLRALYSDIDYAALEGPGPEASVRVQLHADHTYDKMPWAAELAQPGRRGLGAEIRILGVDPDRVERSAVERGFKVVIPTADFAHGWRACFLEDPDGYTFAVGLPTP
ncbi:MAG TPA: VOC family protein [Candidatus Acidoferrales bacterium]|nr:VOC family protein [Candidatus Acidoferrales bacterium]